MSTRGPLSELLRNDTRWRVVLSMIVAGGIAILGFGPFLRSMVTPILVNGEGERLMAAAEMAAVSVPEEKPEQWASRIQKLWPGVHVFVIDITPEKDGGSVALTEQAERHHTTTERLVQANISGRLLTRIDPDDTRKKATGRKTGWEALVRVSRSSNEMAVIGMRINEVEARDLPLWRLVTMYGLLAILLSLTGGLIVAFLTVVRPVSRAAAAAARLLDTSEGPQPVTELGKINSALDSAARIHVEDRRALERQDWEIRRMRNDLKGAQTTLIRAEKLASVGQLAAGIAHEIGNPVGIILGMSDILRQGDSSPREITEFANEIHKATRRVDATIRDLLTFARPVRDEGAKADVAQVVESTIRLLESHRHFKNVQVDFRNDAQETNGDSVSLAEIRPSQLQQVMVNLLLNAASAMNGNGRIEVFTAIEERRLNISVHDFGPGIPEKDLERIFDPFFTTKPPGEGTGLGLAMSAQIVEIYGGEIVVESPSGQGATFTVKLWLADA